MNERIRELAVAAAPTNSSIPHSEWNIPKEFIEKFAELLVRECAKTIRDSVQTMERGKLRANIAHAATLIEEHFGVKE